MLELGLDGRHPTLLGRIRRRHGNTLVQTLRAVHGSQFLRGLPGSESLAAVLRRLDVEMLDQLERYYPHDGVG